ncbi:hypothetical protein EfmAA96_14740 [Enterococcus faecium]|nr:hypothetical protein EfmAA96_14740 [Enterococcus faecium]
MIDLNNWRNFIPELSQKEVEIPHFDRASLRENGQKNPVWIHFGGGNLYRGFHASCFLSFKNYFTMDLMKHP